MSQQPLDLRGAVRIIRRQKIIIGVALLLGVLAGMAVGVLDRPMFSSTTLVMLPPVVSGLSGGPSHNAETQLIEAGSDPVLARAGRRLDPPMSVPDLRARVQVSSSSPQLIAISGFSGAAGQAEAIANAVADSYIAYLSRSAPDSPAALVAERATPATRVPMAVRLALTGLLGALAGVLVGTVAAVAVGRGDRRLWERDAIANAIGVPVLASLAVACPDDAAGWARLLEDHEAGAAEVWSLDRALQQLRLVGVGEGDSASLTVVSLTSDPAALALGPQVAAYTSSLGMATAFVVGAAKEDKAIEMLRAVCAGPAFDRPFRSGRLRVGVHNPAGAERRPEALTVISMVVDAATPQMADATRTAVTVLGVSAGVATAEQLARVAVSAAGDGRLIAGILVANPDRTDQTTGRLPQLTSLGQLRRPTRATTVESRW